MSSKRFTSPSGALNKSQGSRNIKNSVSPKRMYGGTNANHHLVVSTHAADSARHVATSPSPQSAAAVQSMLNDLIEISQHLASYLEQEVSSNAGPSSNHDATLKAQEIERIVRRVEAYFNKKLESANAARKQLEHRVEELTALLQRSSSGSNSVDAEALRQDLLAEKRQRFQLEEQTQLMTEQHAKVVGTLERRLQKQETQLRDLLSAIDRSSAAGAPPSLDTSTTPGTPRRLLRQQLAQHQETQRALEQYRQHIASNPMDGHFSLAAEDLPRSESESERPQAITTAPPTAAYSKPLEQKKLEYSPLTKQERNDKTIENGGAHRNGSALREVDEISAFLDNITKELEEIKT